MGYDSDREEPRWKTFDETKDSVAGQSGFGSRANRLRSEKAKTPEESFFRPSDFVKKIMTVGMGTFFLTEDAIRSLAKEVKLPTEILNRLLESANKTRKDFYAKFSQDLISRVMDQVDPKALVNEILENHEIEVKLKFKRKKQRNTN